MVEVTKELTYGALKSMPTRMARMGEKLDQIVGRLVSQQLQIDAVRFDIANAYQVVAMTDARVDRIERRPEPTCEPVE